MLEDMSEEDHFCIEFYSDKETGDTFCIVCHASVGKEVVKVRTEAKKFAHSLLHETVHGNIEHLMVRFFEKHYYKATMRQVINDLTHWNSGSIGGDKVSLENAIKRLKGRLAST